MFYKNFQFCYCKVSNFYISSYYTAASNKIYLLMDIFGFSRRDAEYFFSKYPMLAHREANEIIDSYHFCKKIGYSNSDILSYPVFLTSHPLVKVQHYWALEETGCNPVNPGLLSSARKFLHRRISLWKFFRYLHSEINIVDQFLSYLDPPIAKPKLLDKSLSSIDDMTWTDVHQHVLKEWLRVRLNASEEDLIKLFRIHKMFKNKSFRIIEENIKLAESIGLSHEKILKCGYLLNNYPEYPKAVLRDLPNLAGLDMRKAMKTNPKLMMIDPKKIIKIYGILKEYNIPDKFIQQKHQIFTMNTNTVRFRLSEIHRIPELRILLNHANILHLVVHQKKVKSRLSFLQKLQLKCASFQILLNLEDRYFENYIKEGKDINTKSDVIKFFSVLFKKKKEEIVKKINLHPFSQYVPFLDIQSTYDYLIKQGYTQDHIYRAMLILLYPKTKINEAFMSMMKDKDLDFYKLSKVKTLQLALYYIEKEHHFTGNGIWTTESTPVTALEEQTLE